MPLPVVLRDRIQPNADVLQTVQMWGGQLQYARGDYRKFLEKFKQKAYRMRTPSMRATVVVIAPTDLCEDSDISEDKQGYLYDCNSCALKSYDNFRYTITSTTLWDVLNDPEIARKIVHNEPQVTPNASSHFGKAQLYSPIGQDISKLTFPKKDPLRVQKGDIVVFWMAHQNI